MDNEERVEIFNIKWRLCPYRPSHVIAYCPKCIAGGYTPVADFWQDGTSRDQYDCVNPKCDFTGIVKLEKWGEA